MIRESLVSLVPSFTETLRAWGVEPLACTRYCEQPDLPTVGGTKNPDIEAIVALRPSLVLLDKEENRREDAEELLARGVEVFVSDVRDVTQVKGELDRLAAFIGLPPQTSDWPPIPRPGEVPFARRAFVPIWRRPWMSIGPQTYGSTLLAALGIGNVIAEASGKTGDYPELTLDEIASLDPDVILVPSEPYDFEPEHLVPLAAIAPVVRVDGQDLFWWGTRTPAALARLHLQVNAPTTPDL
ncbi:MAG: helical backbone metal receptor [Actinomycetota bacterium]|nr:helical backbone metal receptor [Actinomycetota bacterium]